MAARPTLSALLEPRRRLDICCAACGRRVIWEPEAAIARLGAGETFLGARDRLRCSGCGAIGQGRINARPLIDDWYEHLRRKGLGGVG